MGVVSQRDKGGERQWQKGLEGQCSEVKRGPQHFHDFPRLIVMHGAHPDRLAFKLDATTLFLLRALLFSLPLSPSFSHSVLSRLTSISFLPYKMPPSEHPSVAVFQATSPNVTFFFSSHSVALARLSFFFFFFISPHSSAIGTRTCFRTLARGAFWEKPIPPGSRANCL